MAIKNSWSSGEVLTAADLTDTMKGVYVNAQTGTSYTFGTADSFVTLSNASGGTATIPANSTAAFNTGAVIGVMNAGTAGSFTIGTAAGVTLNAVSGTTTLAPLESATLVKLGTNTWQLSKGGGAGLYLITTQSFSAAASVSVNNCFSTTYSVYMITCRVTGSTNVDIAFRMRVSGTDATGSDYTRQSLYGFSTTAGTDSSTGTSGLIGAANTTNGAFQALIYSPATAVTTFYQSYGGRSDSLKVNVGLHNQAVAYDGITFFPNTGTISGDVRIYGYKN